MKNFDNIIDQELVSGNSETLINELTPLEKVEFLKYLWTVKQFIGSDECFHKLISVL